MLIQALFLGLLANVYLTESAQVVKGSVVRPNNISIEEHNHRIRQFWTPDKLKAAKSLDHILPKLPHRNHSAKTNTSIGPHRKIHGSHPSNKTRIGRDISSNGRQVYTTGKVYFEKSGELWMCSGSIIPSTSGDLVSTAGHCVYDPDQQVWLNSYWVFIPAYSNGNGPYGIWPARNFIALTSWTNNNDQNADVGLVALSTLNGQHIQSQLGSQGIGFNFARLETAYAFGYPANLANGEVLQSCVAQTQNPTDAGSSYQGQRIPCDMTGGCSGGPWLQDVDEATGLGYVTSVNSFIVPSDPNFLYGPYFDSNIGSLYDSASTM